MKRAILMLPCLLTLVACGGDDVADAANRRFANLGLDASYPHAFSYLSGVRELSDGTLLAADPTSQVLLRINLDAGTADTMGREGPGPNEYDGPDHVFPLPGDSTLLVDLGNGRLTVIDPEGTFVSSMPMSTPTEDGRLRTLTPSFVDAEGNLYDGGAYSPDGPQDTTSIRRVDRDTREETEVATGWHTPFGRFDPSAKRPTLQPYDGWAVGEDGRVAVVRANGYSVDLYLPDGHVTHGPTNQVETFPLTPSDMDATLEDMAVNATYAMSMMNEDGVQSMKMGRGLPPGNRSGADDFAWPETLPVFHGGRILISPRGNVWVQRMMPAGSPIRVDVFNDRANLVGYMEMPPNSRVVGFSRRGEPGSGVYLARTDDVGLVWLERHRVIGAGEGH